MKHNEYGRSMVEMLGVLVVMGVLAITAVWGLCADVGYDRKCTTGISVI